VHERQSSAERELNDHISDDDNDGDRQSTFRQVPSGSDFRRHAHCGQAATGSNVTDRRAAAVVETSPAPFRQLPSRDRPEPEIELTDCSSCSSVDTARELRHTVPTRCADSAPKLDTVAPDDDDDDDDEIINVVDDLVT